jgi:hypothetical protein
MKINKAKKDKSEQNKAKRSETNGKNKKGGEQWLELC